MLSGQPWWVTWLVGYAMLATFFLVVAVVLVVWAELERRRASRARRRRERARGGMFGIVPAGVAEEGELRRAAP